MTEPKPVRVHARAMIACMILIICGLGFSAVIPFVSINCTRIDNVVVRDMLKFQPDRVTKTNS